MMLVMIRDHMFTGRCPEPRRYGRLLHRLPQRPPLAADAACFYGALPRTPLAAPNTTCNDRCAASNEGPAPSRDGTSALSPASCRPQIVAPLSPHRRGASAIVHRMVLRPATAILCPGNCRSRPKRGHRMALRLASVILWPSPCPNQEIFPLIPKNRAEREGSGDVPP